VTASMNGHHALQALKPLEVASYLRVQGWRQEADLNGKGSLWLLGPGNGQDEADVTLPLRRDLGDFELRMSEVVRTLGRIECRPEAEIVQDLLTTSSDLIRVRAPSRDAESGSLPLEQAVAFVERSRDLVLAAACAAIDKRASYPTRKPTQATDYLSRVRMGQTERGSYVLTILSPVAPVLVSQPELPLGNGMPDPFERQVTRTLVDGLVALERAARQAAASGGMDAFRQAVQLGVSANLCDAVAGLAAVSPLEGLEVRVAWSRARPRSGAAPTRVFLGSDTIPLIQEAARLFRDTESVEDVEIEGFVTRLARRPDQGSGEITLEGLVEGALRRVSVELSEAVYSLAMQAHQSRQRVSCSGDLVKERGGFRLENPRHFRLLDADDRS
jgi:hypothetical protein